jgi:hypothetical protein
MPAGLSSTGREHAYEVSMQVRDRETSAAPHQRDRIADWRALRQGVAALRDLGPAYDGFGSFTTGPPKLVIC